MTRVKLALSLFEVTWVDSEITFIVNTDFNDFITIYPTQPSSFKEA